MKKSVNKRRTILILVIGFNSLFTGTIYSKNVDFCKKTESFNSAILQKKVASDTLRFSVSNNVNEESALKIDLYMKEREGVLDVITNVAEKEISITIKKGYDSQLMEQLIRYAQHLYVTHTCENHKKCLQK